jgi:hypothetical protein
MGIYQDQLLPRFQDKVMARKATREVRARVCSGLAGEVVEVGFGTGLNARYYPAAVTKVAAVVADFSELGGTEELAGGLPMHLTCGFRTAGHQPSWLGSEFDSSPPSTSFQQMVPVENLSSVVEGRVVLMVST